MEYREIEGDRMPALGFGTWELRGEQCRRAVECALAAGYRHLDTARMYENEAEVGRALRESHVPRPEVFVTTKVWRNSLDEAGVRESIHASLRDLGTDHVNLALVHWPAEEPPMSETLETLTALREEGKVLHVGVSNFPPSLLDRAMELAPVACNQVEYHPLLGQPDMARLARERDFVLTAYSPLAQGKALREEALRDIADSHGRTPAQVVLRWFLQQDRVAALPRSSDPEHIRGNLDVFDFELSEEEMQEIFQMDRGERLVDPEWSPDWERPPS